MGRQEKSKSSYRLLFVTIITEFLLCSVRNAFGKKWNGLCLSTFQPTFESSLEPVFKWQSDLNLPPYSLEFKFELVARRW